MVKDPKQATPPKRPRCAECNHHPVERADECACECHDIAADLVESGIREYRVLPQLMTEANRARLGDAMKRQVEAKQRLRDLCVEKHPKRRRA